MAFIIISTIGIYHLTKLTIGDYNGWNLYWPYKKQKRLGLGLLHEILQICLIEGKSQIFSMLVFFLIYQEIKSTSNK